MQREEFDEFQRLAVVSERAAFQGSGLVRGLAMLGAPGNALQPTSATGLRCIMLCQAQDLRRRVLVFCVKNAHSYPHGHCIQEMPTLSQATSSPTKYI